MLCVMHEWSFSSASVIYLRFRCRNHCIRFGMFGFVDLMECIAFVKLVKLNENYETWFLIANALALGLCEMGY